MSEADKLFDELGYKKINEFRNIIHYEKDISDKNSFNIYRKLIIEFVIEHEFISMASKVGNEYIYSAFNELDMETLEAINKKCEELGWK